MLNKQFLCQNVIIFEFVYVRLFKGWYKVLSKNCFLDIHLVVIHLNPASDTCQCHLGKAGCNADCCLFSIHRESARKEKLSIYNQAQLPIHTSSMQPGV